MPSVDLTWTLISFVLTLFIFSYLFGDNPLFRLASYLFVGVAAGYAAVLVLFQVILPRLVWPLLENPLGQPLLYVPFLLGLMLLMRIFPRMSWLGRPSMGYLVGAGAAVMTGGAVMGTLLGQAGGAVAAFDFTGGRNPIFQLAEGLVLLAGTVCSLVYFQFTAPAPGRRSGWVEGLSKAGEIFIAITLGALFAGAFAAALTALIDRLDFLIETLFMLF